MPPIPGFNWFESTCKLYKRTALSSEWHEYKKVAKIIFSPFGFTIRDDASQTLLCDFPFSAIDEIRILEPMLLKIVQRQSPMTFVIQFPREKTSQDFQGSLKKHNVTVVSEEELRENLDRDEQNPYPNLQDVATKEVILSLLFNDKFKGFVGELSTLLQSYEKNI